MRIQELYHEAKQALKKAPKADSGLEAFFLLEQALGATRAQLLSGDRDVSEEDTAYFRALLRRRLAGEPLQYILGRWEFFGLPMAVGEGVLIPRPETELLVEHALAELVGKEAPNVLDLCSGSGCIPVAVGHRRPDAFVWGVERALEAYRFFVTNVSLAGTLQVVPLLGDVFALPEEVLARTYHVITANPPYVAAPELAGLQEEVLWEPTEALDGGEDGLDFYRRLPGICLPLLEPGGMLLLEVGDGQGDAVAGLLLGAGYVDISVHNDLAGHSRLVTGRRKGL